MHLARCFLALLLGLASLPGHADGLRFTLVRTSGLTTLDALTLADGDWTRKVRVNHTALLIQHHAATLLFDTGLGSQAQAQFAQDMPWWDKPLFRFGEVHPVREQLAGRGILGTSVLWFERDYANAGRPLPPGAWREACLATVTTHDLPSTAARLTGEHVELRHRLGLLTRPLAEEQAADAAEVAEWLDVLTRLGLLPEGPRDEEGAIRAVHRFLLRTPARMVGVWLPDAVGDRRPQNLPGTWDQYPNWRLPIADATGRPVTLEELADSPRLHALVAELRATGGG